MELGWRDIAMAMGGIVMILIGFTISMIRTELARKADQSTVHNDRRRLDDHIADNIRQHGETSGYIGKLFSVVSDEKTDRLEAHIELLTQQNANQQAVMSTLASITARATGNEKRE